MRLCGRRLLSSANTPDDRKSVMQRDFEQKEKWTIDALEEAPKKLSARETRIEEDKQRLMWRRPLDEEDKLWKSKFSVFNSNENDMTMMMMLQQPWDFTPANLKRLYAEYKLKKEAYEQGFIAERVRMLGPDLAIAHFMTYRGGKVRFRGFEQWTTATDRLSLPKLFDPNYVVEAVNFDNQPLHYEGVENFRDLANCKSISLRNCRHFDDWCLDRLSGNTLPSLEELDISGTDVTTRGFGVIYRMSALRRLIIDKQVHNSIEWQLIYAMLEEMSLNLKVLDSNEVAQL